MRRRSEASAEWAGLEAAPHDARCCTVGALIDALDDLGAATGSVTAATATAATATAATATAATATAATATAATANAATAIGGGGGGAGPFEPADAEPPPAPWPTEAEPPCLEAYPEPPYLFDWSLPQHCPSLLDELVVPRHFAGDLLQRATRGTLYREAWPSLFIGPAGSRCARSHPTGAHPFHTTEHTPPVHTMGLRKRSHSPALPRSTPSFRLHAYPAVSALTHSAIALPSNHTPPRAAHLHHPPPTLESSLHSQPPLPNHQIPPSP